MIIQEASPELIKAKMRGPIYIWIGMCAMSAYFAWQAFVVTDTRLQAQIPTFDASVPLMLPLTLCAVGAGFLAWLFPIYLFRLGSSEGKGLSIRLLAFVVRLGFIGSINIYGLVLATMTKDGNIILPFTIFTFLGYIRSFPKPETFGFK